MPLSQQDLQEADEALERASYLVWLALLTQLAHRYELDGYLPPFAMVAYELRPSPRMPSVIPLVHTGEDPEAMLAHMRKSASQVHLIDIGDIEERWLIRLEEWGFIGEPI